MSNETPYGSDTREQNSSKGMESLQRMSSLPLNNLQDHQLSSYSTLQNSQYYPRAATFKSTPPNMGAEALKSTKFNSRVIKSP